MAVAFSVAVAQDSAEPAHAPDPMPKDDAAAPGNVLLIDSLGRVVSVPRSSLPPGLAPPPGFSLLNQVPNNTAAGGKLPPEVLERVEAGSLPVTQFRLFPSAQSRMASYLAGQDQLGNTAVRPGPLFDVIPFEPLIQKPKYWLSRQGLRYLMRQTLNYAGLDDAISGTDDLGFYTMDLQAKWTLFESPGVAGGLSMKFDAKTGIGSAGQTQDAGTNIGSLTDPTPIWSSHNGFRVPELAWQQSWDHGKLVLLAGVISQGNYIDGNLYANSGRGQFMNSALIDTMVVPLPSYNFGVNLQWQPSDHWYAMLGVSAGRARAGQQPWTNFSWDDWSVLGEVGYMPDDVLGLGPGIYRVQPFLSRAGGPMQGGVGFNFQQKLGEKSPFGWFGRFGAGGSQVSAGASAQVATGFVMQGPLAYAGLAPRLFNDLFGVGFVWSQPSATTKTVYHRSEYAFETFYTLQVSPTLRLQPDFQLVWNPVFSPDAGPAPVFQLEYILAW